MAEDEGGEMRTTTLSAIHLGADFGSENLSLFSFSLPSPQVLP